MVLPDGAWRWENWGKGQGEREDIKNEKRKKSTKRGLESKSKAGNMRKRRVFYTEKRRWKQFVKEELKLSLCLENINTHTDVNYSLTGDVVHRWRCNS